METKSKFDTSISFIRVVSMACIIVTHLVAEIKGFSFLAQLLNYAVYTFLFLSGYLFGPKQIDNFKSWIVKRLSRILVAMYVYVLFLFVMRLIMFGEFDFWKFIVHLLNLQGLLGAVPGAGHLWFITAIMLCYFITPLLYKAREYILNTSWTSRVTAIIAIMVVQFLTSLAWEKAGIYIGYLLIYAVGYYVASIWNKKLTSKAIVIATVIMICGMVLRLAGKYLMDDTPVYNATIVPLTQSILAIYTFIILYQLKRLANNKYILRIVNHFDKISFEVFIVHYAFIVGPFFIWGATGNIVIDSILVILASYLSALVLSYICKALYKTKAIKFGGNNEEIKVLD